MLNQNVAGFQVPPGANPPPHLAWLYGNQRPYHQFGYGKSASPKSITVTGGWFEKKTAIRWFMELYRYNE